MKLRKKNIGNDRLANAIKDFIADFEKKNWSNEKELKMDRPDADMIHSDSFYFFDIHVHRTLVSVEYETQEATILWLGTHDEYETTFKNNKDSIAKWLRANEYIA